MFSSIERIGAAGLILLLASGCASDQTPADAHAPSALASARALAPDENRSASWTYVTPNVDLSRYRRFILFPAEVYHGAEADFGSADASRQLRYAQILTEELSRGIGEAYPLVNSAGPDVAILKPTLVGVEATVGGLATASRLLPVGMVANLASGATGGTGSFTGSMTVAIEVFDSRSSALLGAAVRRQAPAVFDIESTLSTEDTVRASARLFARQVREAIDRRQVR